MRYCHDLSDYESMRFVGSALAEVLTEYHAIFRKKHKYKLLGLFERTKTIIEYVRIPKRYESNYDEKKIVFWKQCITLIDKGFYNSDITPEIENRWREYIAEYQISKGEVWE